MQGQVYFYPSLLIVAKFHEALGVSLNTPHCGRGLAFHPASTLQEPRLRSSTHHRPRSGKISWPLYLHELVIVTATRLSADHEI